MALKTKYVFVDTQSFVSHGLHFQTAALKSFQDLCERERLFHLTTTIVKREVESNITESIKEALSSLGAFRKKARVLNSVKNEAIIALFADLNEDHALKESIIVFNEYLSATKAKVLTLSEANIEEIFNKYFSRQPPFGDKKKKAEFPDATSLSVLEKHADKLNEFIYIVSSDPDYLSYCINHPRLISVDSLSKLLDIYNSHESEITELVKNFINGVLDDLSTRVIDEIESAGAYNDDSSWEDSEVTEFTVEHVDLFDISVVSADESSAVVAVDFEASMHAEISGPDWNGGYYDSEAKRLMTFGNKNIIHQESRYFTADVSITYEYSDGSLKDCEIDDLKIDGINFGVPFSIEESD